VRTKSTGLTPKSLPHGRIVGLCLQGSCPERSCLPYIYRTIYILSYYLRLRVAIAANITLDKNSRFPGGAGGTGGSGGVPDSGPGKSWRGVTFEEKGSPCNKKTAVTSLVVAINTNT